MQTTVETFGGIEIHGSKDFIAEMKEALTLLQYSHSFQEVLPFLTKIDSADILGSKGAEHRYDSNKPAYNHTSISYGGDIARLAYRSMLLQSGKRKSTDIEKRCAEFRAKVEQELYRFSLNDYRQSFMHW
ncbi:MAG: hypothetical protein WC455_03470 [Dehalococcoidia bacterium]|jgi:hypothetical protein